MSCSESVDKSQNCLSFQTIVYIDAADETKIQCIPNYTYKNLCLQILKQYVWPVV